MIKSKKHHAPIASNADIQAEITCAALRGEVLTRRDAIKRINERWDADKRRYGWYNALKRARELHLQREFMDDSSM